MKKSLYLTAALMMLGTSFFTSCREDLEDVSNEAYVEDFRPVETLYLDGSFDTKAYTLSCRLANPAETNLEVVYGVEENLVAVYNDVYNASATLLPADFYDLNNPVAKIEAGQIYSSTAEVTFKNLDLLPGGPVYVLPVSVMSSPVDVLSNYRTVYYVLREASLINVVADLTKTCLVFNNQGQQPLLNGFTQMTFECLVYPDNFNNTLSTLMGIEGSFLYRVGDAGIPSNQIQVAGSPNATDSQWQLETRKWTAVAIMWDGTTGTAEVYFNGVKRGNTQRSSRGTVNWNNVSSDRGCYIGYAYDTNRDFQGYMSEVRIWNRLLTTEELNARNHFYTVNPESEGLVFYAKMNEGAGKTIKDYANGYDMIVPETYPGKSQAPGELKWVPVSLPEEE